MITVRNLHNIRPLSCARNCIENRTKRQFFFCYLDNDVPRERNDSSVIPLAIVTIHNATHNNIM